MAFYKKYFPESAREAKEMELMQLKQGSLSVVDYTNKFEELCRFSRVCQGAPKTYESWKCIKYQRDLKDSIMTIMAPLEIRVFSDLVNKARVVKEYAKPWRHPRTLMEGALAGGMASIFTLEDKASRDEDMCHKAKGASERTIRINFSMLRKEEIRVRVLRI
ncbi:hypothetical protein AHAS_Ahas03G0207200 [Arachis hypogaea]